MSGNGHATKMHCREYEAELARLQGELVALQKWVKTTGAGAVWCSKGSEPAGKGGTIKRIVERVIPRVFRVVAAAWDAGAPRRVKASGAEAFWIRREVGLAATSPAPWSCWSYHFVAVPANESRSSP